MKKLLSLLLVALLVLPAAALADEAASRFSCSWASCSVCTS